MLRNPVKSLVGQINWRSKNALVILIGYQNRKTSML